MTSKKMFLYIPLAIVIGLISIIFSNFFYQWYADVINEKLFIAIKNNDKKEIMNALKSGTNINEKIYRYPLPLIYACLHSNRDVVVTLLTNGANVNQKTREGQSALTTAAGKGKLEIVKLLLEHGANKDYRPIGGYTAFEKAASYGKLNIVKYFINNFKIKEEEYNTGFIFAAKNGHINTMRFLLGNKNITISVIDEALIDSINMNEQYKTVKFLIDNGANVNTIKLGDSVLDEAIYYKHIRIIKLLKEHGAKTAEELALTEPNKPDIREFRVCPLKKK